jgi:hypothetical protein
MIRNRFLLFVILFISQMNQLISAGFAGEVFLRAEKAENGITVWAGDEVFTTLKTGKEQKYPYFYPVNGPLTNTSVTTETSEPYPHHHSLFFGCDRVNGGNYWQEDNARGQIVPTRLELIQAEGEKIVIENENTWIRTVGGEDNPFRDRRVITIQAPEVNIRIIDFVITVTAQEDVTIQKNNHSLFAARMVPELAVTGNGTLINAKGDKGEKETFGVEAEWCDYFGNRDGKTEGLAIFAHPDNPDFPPPWFTRDYGFFSPTPLNWIEEPAHMASGESATLKYRVIIHSGTTEEAAIGELYKQWIME